jgi:hypothetical protein
MITRKFWVFALIVVGVVATFAASGTNRDTGIDLLKIATRLVENYSATQHKAGDADGVFVEDVVVPSVVNVADSYKGEIPPAVRKELYRFLIAGKSMASEELSTLAAKLYLKSPKQFCRDVSRLGKLDRRLLVKQASDGLELNGAKTGKTKCA